METNGSQNNCVMSYTTRFNIIQRLVNSVRNQVTSTSGKQDVISNAQKFEIIRRATHLYMYLMSSQERVNAQLLCNNFQWSTGYIPSSTASAFPSMCDAHKSPFALSDIIAEPDSGLPSSDSSHKSIFVTTTTSHECPLCGKKHNSASALKMHQRTHNPPCICPQCGKAFSRMWLLSGHLRTHTGERPYVCGRCQRAFADRSNLRAHMQTHTTRKRYQCEKCPRSFSRQSLLRKHTSQCCGRTIDPR